MKINKKDLGDKLVWECFDIFMLGVRYGQSGNKISSMDIKHKCRKKVFKVLDSTIISKEDELREAEFENKLLSELINEV